MCHFSKILYQLFFIMMMIIILLLVVTDHVVNSFHMINHQKHIILRQRQHKKITRQQNQRQQQQERRSNNYYYYSRLRMMIPDNVYVPSTAIATMLDSIGDIPNLMTTMTLTLDSSTLSVITKIPDVTTTTTSMIMISSTLPNEDMISNFVPIIIIFAITIGVVANVWIQTLLSGERGIGSYLSDGGGYNKSSFRPIDNKKKNSNISNNNNMNDMVAVQNDPLPWLKLPKFDFVEVAGQIEEEQEAVNVVGQDGSNNNENKNSVDEEILVLQLERLRLEMKYQIQEGNMKDAIQIRNQLEKMMKENNIEYK